MRFNAGVVMNVVTSAMINPFERPVLLGED